MNFPKNIRSNVDDLDDSQLRASLEAFGWKELFPAIEDQDGNVLVGHRRLKIARELNIDPVVRIVNCTSDKERWEIAIASNVGHEGMSKEDRQRIAQRMYTDGTNLTQQQIAALLGVAKGTISKDLSSIVSNGNNQKPHPNTVRNPKGAGRPHGSGRKPKPLKEENNATSVKPDIDVKQLSMSAQKKLSIALRKQIKEQARIFRQRVDDEVKRSVDEMVLPYWREKIEKAKELYARRKGLMNKETFNTIRRALHPDSRQSISDKKLSEAFDAFMALEKFLLDEKDSPTDFPDLPKSWDDWERAKRKETAARRAKRDAGHSSLRPH